MMNNEQNENPMAGDLVRIAYSFDPMYKRGSIGVIEGEIGKQLDKINIKLEPEMPIEIENGEVKGKGEGVRLYNLDKKRLKRMKSEPTKKMLFDDLGVPDSSKYRRHIFTEVKLFKLFKLSLNE
jgi:hypothetical protein